MNRGKPLLLIPVENQVRELDPKLLLACIAARRGFASVVGSRREMEFSIDSFPRSIYLSKSMTVRSLLFFRVASTFGHKIVTWDEEALVHLPSDIYYSRRLDPRAIQFVSNLFAWGEDNADLWRTYPHLPDGIPVHITGNPRSDMLRPEMRTFYEEQILAIHRRYGNFILVNTNFNHVNAFGPDMNLFKPALKPDSSPRFGRAARGMTLAYAEGLRDHKQALFEDFQRLIPRLEKAFPEYIIIVRPHPTENQNVYREIAARCERVQVTNEGNVVPWLMATRALIHNGCTTGVEAYLAGIPAITYRSTVNDDYDNGFYRLSNSMSHQCFSFDELRDMLQKVLNGELESADGDQRRRLIDRFLAAQSGPLACERIVDVLETMTAGPGQTSPPDAFQKLKQVTVARGLQLAKNIKAHLPGSHNRPEFQHHRYPRISIDEIRSRLSRFQRLLGETGDLKVDTTQNQFFYITS